jgi:hypothetical protein
MVVDSKEVIVQQHKSRRRKPGDDCSIDLCGCEILFFVLGGQCRFMLRDSGFCREVYEKCALLRQLRSEKWLFLYGFLTLEEGTDMLSRNNGKKLPLLAAH